MGIVTEGLIGYWHYQQGINGSTWENIAPSTKGQYNGTINGAVLQADGMFFDGVDDSVDFPNLGISGTSFTLEIKGGYSGNSGYLMIAGFTHRIGFWNSSNFVQSIFNGGGFTNSANNTIVAGQSYTLTYRYDKSKSLEELFINGVSVKTRTGATTTNLNTTFKMAYDSVNQTKYSGAIPYLRIYNRALTNQEIQQNYQEGTNIGLVEQLPVNEPPKVVSLSSDTFKVSHIIGFDVSLVKFKFDKDVVEWRINQLGSSHDTGVVIESGSNVTANVEIVAAVNSTDLTSEGQNRLNIYGKDVDGNWTSYED